MSEEKREDTSSVRVGDLVDCVVSQIMPYGAFVNLTESGKRGMIHISELSFNFVKKVEDVLSLQQNVKAKVIKIDDKGRIDLSLKKGGGTSHGAGAALSRREGQLREEDGLLSEDQRGQDRGPQQASRG